LSEFFAVVPEFLRHFVQIWGRGQMLPFHPPVPTPMTIANFLANAANDFVIAFWHEWVI